MAREGNQPWVEKYRPQKIADVIFQDAAQRKYFEGVVKSRDLQHLFFAGVQGTGKSTLSHVLINELGVDPLDLMKVKCSKETGVDAMRDKVGRFAETMPLGDFKIVQLEEFDRISVQGQDALKHIIEDNSTTCKFIATLNNPHHIVPAVKSRFQEFHFKAPDQDLVLEKIATILDLEGVEIDDIEVLEKIVMAGYPDIRKTINLAYQSSRSGKLVWKESTSSADSDWKIALINFLETGNWTSARKLVCENILRDEFEEFYQWMYQNIHKFGKFKNVDKEEAAIVVIADHLGAHITFAHPDINLAKMFIILGQI